MIINQSTSSNVDKQILYDPQTQIKAFLASNRSSLLVPKSYNRITSIPAPSTIIFGSNYIATPLDRGASDQWLYDARLIFTISALTGTG